MKPRWGWGSRERGGAWAWQHGVGLAVVRRWSSHTRVAHEEFHRVTTTLMMFIIILQLFVVIFTFLHAASIFDQTSKGKCQPIEIPLCKDAPYNYTYFPNPYLQQDQQSVSDIVYFLMLSLSTVDVCVS
ncbi:hypothetical protein DICVIV_11723 [Dictyocaulus viviparus]|uniref:FZ domain-containing protein n=1 Tax=Dictyocaulus viviparus TaxID=29172 RepID=A0A0D8XF25_DICVI|nr:hypothetical protein DICVIV_11723 [Dictyocaulus viviparus]